MIELIIAAIIGYVIWIDVQRIIQEQKKPAFVSPIREVDKMTGEEFEKFLLVQFKKLDYHVILTSISQDYGADLVLRKDGLKIVVQAKRWKKTVSVKAVQEAAAAVRYYSADQGIVITNNTFTRNAYNLARSNDIELWDRKKLIEFIISAKKAG